MDLTAAKILRKRVLRSVGIVLIAQALPHLLNDWLHNNHDLDFQVSWRSITLISNLIVDSFAVVAGLLTWMRPKALPLVVWSIIAMLSVINWLTYEAMPTNSSFRMLPATTQFWEKILADLQYFDVRFWLPVFCMAICWTIKRHATAPIRGFEII